ncbi:hypothetical protein CP532_6010 [Ophiocordyceps camponoti-leonardi (nom. inval.)]|nr:hypothetical protein CP532_6010 [Ophiocordyceps camponoti-leonardi (nom. inval.)]
MAPKSTPTTKANYKSYEAQARMVRAMVAAHPDVKWNYKEIAACIGSDVSENAINHRFRPIRAQATIIREARAQGLDIKDLLSQDELPATQDAIDKQNIAKYFGQSTGDGIQFQFRGIKRDAELLRQTEAEGGDVASALVTSASPGSNMTTPSRATPSRRGGGKARRGGGGGIKRGPGGKRGHRSKVVKVNSSDEGEDGDGDDDGDEDDDDANLNWDARDVTPSAKRNMTTPVQKPVVPRRAAQRACATIADAAAQLRDSSVSRSPSPSPKVEVTDADPIRVRSIFGPHTDHDDSFTPRLTDEYGDGEI